MPYLPKAETDHKLSTIAGIARLGGYIIRATKKTK